MDLKLPFHSQSFPNGYELINGVERHKELGAQFQIPPLCLKAHVDVGHFVELRVDSNRFSAHPDAPEQCACDYCNEITSKPVLCHEQPASIFPVPSQKVPSRGWGEQFWLRVTCRKGDYFQGTVDNTLHETPLHELQRGAAVIFHGDHILAIHQEHYRDILLAMNEEEHRAMEAWIRQSIDD